MKRSWRKRAIVISLALVLAVSLYSKIGSDGAHEVPVLQTAADLEHPAEVENLPQPGRQSAAGVSPRSNNSPNKTMDRPVTSSRPSYTLDPDISINEWMDSYDELVRNATVEDYHLQRQEAEEGDAEAAYWLHEFFQHCKNAPRSEWQLDKALQRAERRVDRAARLNSEHRLNRVLNTLDWYEQSYTLCSFLGPDFDTQAESLSWLETAADLGHMGAQRIYHYQARQLITGSDSNLAYQNPDLISAFKMNASRYARSLFETDHPQGYLLVARMYFVGDVYEQDYIKSYAHARAASLIANAGAQSDAQNWMRVIGANLPPTELAEAEQLARDLLKPGGS